MNIFYCNQGNLCSVFADVKEGQTAGKSKQPLSNGGKPVRGSGVDGRFVARASHLAPKSGPSYKLNSTSQTSKASVDSRKQLGSNSGNGPGRPVGPKGPPSKMPVNTMGNKSFTPGMKNPVNGVKKPLPSKVSSSVPKQSVEQRKDAPRQSMDQRKDIREHYKHKMLPKQPVAPSKSQV